MSRENNSNLDAANLGGVAGVAFAGAGVPQNSTDSVVARAEDLINQAGGLSEASPRTVLRAIREAAGEGVAVVAVPLSGPIRDHRVHE